MKKEHILFYFLLIISAISCTKNNEPKIEKSIQKLIKIFPQLKSNSKTFGNDYKLVRSVKNGKFDFEIYLYSELDSIKNKQEIIVFVNSKKECYAIPFFSNKYKDYWEFPFDKQIPNDQKVNSTFTYELNNALQKLTGIKNPKKEVIDYEITKELLFSILHCRNLEERDSLLVYKKIHMNTEIPEENSDSAFIRLRKNYELMKKDWHPREFEVNYNCYLDEKNARIYQFKYDKNKKQNIIKTYRQDYGFRYIYL